MEKLKAKLKKQGGFTLVEMLIVVAIIAILVAVSIPLVNNALERAKHATDAANERAAKAEILLCYLTDVDSASKVAQGEVWFYDAAAGKLTKTFGGITGYGKHDKIANREDAVIAVMINTSDEVEMQWTTSSISSITASSDLCSINDVSH